MHYGDVIAHDSQGNLVLAENALVATVGLRDHVVVQTKDAVMVAPRERAGEVKQIFARLKVSGRNEHHVQTARSGC